ncbi:MAG TPA: efflux RND transporter periplasmic adaptor subunit [Tepidisphaeraceae bacterium]
MNQNRNTGLLRGLGLLLVTGLAAGAFAQSAPIPSPARPGDILEQGVTQPSLRKELAFSFQGIIAKTNVKEGDTVKAGQELLRQDDRIEVARLQGLKLDADRTLLVKAKTATLENKRLVMKRKEESYKKQAIAISEYQEAQLDVVLAEAEVELARHEAEVKGADVSLQTTHVELLTLKSPIDGIVEKVVQTEGEVADIQKPSVVVVKNDPLYIDLKTLRTAVVQRLKTGDTLAVRYPGEDTWHAATINLIAPVADARAGTQAIRLEMPNPDNRSTGLAIEVKIPTAAVADARQ